MVQQINRRSCSNDLCNRFNLILDRKPAGYIRCQKTQLLTLQGQLYQLYQFSAVRHWKAYTKAQPVRSINPKPVVTQEMNILIKWDKLNGIKKKPTPRQDLNCRPPRFQPVPTLSGQAWRGGPPQTARPAQSGVAGPTACSVGLVYCLYSQHLCSQNVISLCDVTKMFQNSHNNNKRHDGESTYNLQIFLLRTQDNNNQASEPHEQLN